MFDALKLAMLSAALAAAVVLAVEGSGGPGPKAHRVVPGKAFAPDSGRQDTRQSGPYRPVRIIALDRATPVRT